MLPFDTEDPHLIEQRDQLSTECHNLHHLLQQRDEIEELLRQGKRIRPWTQPKPCSTSKSHRHWKNNSANWLKTADSYRNKPKANNSVTPWESLTHAETAYQTGDLKQCRSLLRFVLPFLDRMEPDTRQRAEQLDQATIASSRQKNRSKRNIVAWNTRNSTEPTSELEAIDTAAYLPPRSNASPTCAPKIEHTREEYRAQRARQLNDWLTQIAEHLERVEVEQAEKLLGKVKLPDDVDQELSRKYERLRADTVRDAESSRRWPKLKHC